MNSFAEGIYQPGKRPAGRCSPSGSYPPVSDLLHHPHDAETPRGAFVENKGSVPVTGDVIRSFNRDTAWLATGVLGAVGLAALMLAVEERQSKATQAERDLLPNANFATVTSVVAKGSNSNGKVTSGPGSSIDPTFAEPPLQEIPSSEMEPAATSPISAPAFTLQKNRDAPRQD